MQNQYGTALRRAVYESGQVAFMGIYDMMSATCAARHFNAFWVSGYGLAASHYGLPDVGFICWVDVIALVSRLRGLFPNHHILVDIDDGYADIEVACHVVRELERAGASGVVLEDQARPRRCGHVGGKLLIPPQAYADKLAAVLDARTDMVVISRTDAVELDDIQRRMELYASLKPDALLIDGVKDLNIIRRLHERTQIPFTFNQMNLGVSPPATLTDLVGLGVQYVIYSAPLLFAAIEAMDNVMEALRVSDGQLPATGLGVKACNALLDTNLARTQQRPTQLRTISEAAD